MENFDILQETTVWETATPNHIYAIHKNSGKMLGYIPYGSDDWTIFTKPLPFYKSRRTFKKLKVEDLFNE
jgi:hypothetical protein